MLKLSKRLFSSGSRLYKLSPAEMILQKEAEKVKDTEFKSSLLSGTFPYEPKYIGNSPINVELLKYKPIRLPKTHGHQVVDLRFRGYNEEDIQLTSEFASRAAYYLGIPVSGSIKHKTEKRLYTVIRSPFAQAKSKENFWRTTYNYQLKAFDANADVVDLWLSYLNKYALSTVEYKAQITVREGEDFVKQLEAISEKDIEIPDVYKQSDDPVLQKVDELLKQFQK